MIQVSLYINSTESGAGGEIIDNWLHADLDTSVNISLNDSIKDAKDIGKVMTAYSNQFKLPASKNNNIIFKYFHNHNVLNGFDSRRKHAAILKLNGFDYKKGYIKLNKVSLKDNYPSSYDVQFFGELSSLKDILGTSELKDLTSLSKFNHENTIANIIDGFEAGLAFDFSGGDPVITRNSNGDIKYPFLSHTRGFEYTGQGMHRLLTNEEIAADYVVTSADRLDFTDLKPAIRAIKIIEAIEEDFPQIQFDKEWLNNAPFFFDLFIWLHREKSYLTYRQGINANETFTFTRNLETVGGNNEWDILSGTELRPLESVNGGDDSVYYDCRFVVESVGAEGVFSMQLKIYRDGYLFSTNEITDIEAGSGSTIRVLNIGRNFNSTWKIVCTVIADNTISSITPTLLLDRFEESGGGGGTTSAEYGLTGGSLSLVSDILVPQSMPKKKITDFLSDLFKTFNLVAFEDVQSDGTYKINIKSLDDFYRSGYSYDITKYVDISNSSVERIAPYSSISLKFPEGKTYLAINQRELTGDDFGSIEFKAGSLDEGASTSDSLLFDGGAYSVEPKFEKMMFDRMVRLDGIRTNLQWGWFVNDNKENLPEPTIGEALLMYINNKPLTSTSFIKWSNDHISNGNYNRPSNVMNNGIQTLHFNAEVDEFTYEENENSLFNNFYKNYISGIYSPYARRVVVDCYLPPLVFLKIKLNDTIEIGGTAFLIDSIKTNLTNGKTALELLRITDYETIYVVPKDGQLTWDTEETLWEDKAQVWSEASELLLPPSASALASGLKIRVSNDSGIFESETCLIELIESLGGGADPI